MNFEGTYYWVYNLNKLNLYIREDIFIINT